MKSDNEVQMRRRKALNKTAKITKTTIIAIITKISPLPLTKKEEEMKGL